MVLKEFAIALRITYNQFDELVLGKCRILNNNEYTLDASMIFYYLM